MFEEIGQWLDTITVIAILFYFVFSLYRKCLRRRQQLNQEFDLQLNLV
ncbi:ORF5a protein [Lactate dehydrogenase-elevating virus]|nr:ORF5a protein [Lactate dehydrogenase-elevating virus]WKR37875.1 ORF5a protein [Lactate dehydrogenase-elevating virus]